MSWKLLTFEPADVIIGSDHRSLDDSNYSLDTELSPLAFAGAIRTHILLDRGYDFARPPVEQTGELQALGIGLGVAFKRQPDPVVAADRFAVRGPVQWRHDQRGRVVTWWAMPRSIVADESGKTAALRPDPDSGTIADAGLGGCAILSCDLKHASPMEGSCNFADLKECLTGSLPFGKPHRLHEVELRTGHRRNQHGVAQDQALFSRETRRFAEYIEPVKGTLRRAAGYAMFGRIDSAWSPRAGASVRLGGDGHAAILDVHEPADLLKEIDTLKGEVVSAIERGAGLSLYLGAPAWFQGGWRPAFDKTAGVRLVAAAVDSPRTIAGWDVGRGKPKPPIRVVPEGAVYFYEVLDAALARQKIIDPFHFNESVSDQHGPLGFGLALCGFWRQD